MSLLNGKIRRFRILVSSLHDSVSRKRSLFIKFIKGSLRLFVSWLGARKWKLEVEDFYCLWESRDSFFPWSLSRSISDPGNSCGGSALFCLHITRLISPKQLFERRYQTSVSQQSSSFRPTKRFFPFTFFTDTHEIFFPWYSESWIYDQLHYY